MRPALPYGTIVAMTDHRIRLTDDDIDLIVAALRARGAMTKGKRRHRVIRLAERLAELTPGNPRWILDADRQLQEALLDDEDLEDA